MSWFNEFFQDGAESDGGLVEDLDAAFDNWSMEVEEEFLDRDHQGGE